MSLELIEILYAAVHADLGVCVETDDPERLRQKLYPMRKENPDFLPLSFIISPLNPADLWIIKQPKETVNAEE
jgi:hypothetical protein